MKKSNTRYWHGDEYPQNLSNTNGRKNPKTPAEPRDVAIRNHLQALLCPNTCRILIREYGLNWEDKVIAYITKEISNPKIQVVQEEV